MGWILRIALWTAMLADLVVVFRGRWDLMSVTIAFVASGFLGVGVGIRNGSVIQSVGAGLSYAVFMAAAVRLWTGPTNANPRGLGSRREPRRLPVPLAMLPLLEAISGLLAGAAWTFYWWGVPLRMIVTALCVLLLVTEAVGGRWWAAASDRTP